MRFWPKIFRPLLQTPDWCQGDFVATSARLSGRALSRHPARFSSSAPLLELQWLSCSLPPNDMESPCRNSSADSKIFIWCFLNSENLFLQRVVRLKFSLFLLINYEKQEELARLNLPRHTSKIDDRAALIRSLICWFLRLGWQNRAVLYDAVVLKW